MKNFFVIIFALVSLFCTVVQAEIIGAQREEKEFGDWKVFCEIDPMMDTAHCKIASKFYEDTAVITIEPTTKFLNQLFLVIPQIKVGTFLKIRIDKNDLILSRNVKQSDFGMIPIDDQQKLVLYDQMHSGSFLYLRFNVRDSEKEITARISLKGFKNALSYYNSRVSH